jgi:hypothetical protein
MNPQEVRGSAVVAAGLGESGASGGDLQGRQVQRGQARRCLFASGGEAGQVSHCETAELVVVGGVGRVHHCTRMMIW